MAGWEELFRGIDPDKVKEAMERAKTLSENPTVQQAFSCMNQKDVTDMLRSLSNQDKNQLLKSLFQSKNKDFLNLISKMK